MPFVFSHVEYCDRHFVYGFCNSNARAAVEEYQRRFPDRRIRLEVQLLIFTRQHVRLAVFQVLLCSPIGRWYERLIHERTFLRWFREVHVCPLVEWPLTSAYHVCRCGELYIRKIYILTMIKGYNIWNQATNAQRCDLCHWITAHPKLLSVILFTDEASFTWDGINNSRNLHYVVP